MAPDTRPQPVPTKLQYKKLGDSDLLIVEITLGTMIFGEQSTDTESHDMPSYSFGQGINILDAVEIVYTFLPFPSSTVLFSEVDPSFN
uniref:Uncharacterized protein n=1 Tax=Triticum urartu TaxID=4572 RepID=A0A8R7VG43_TRIUA